MLRELNNTEEENRLLRKLIYGIEMIYNPLEFQAEEDHTASSPIQKNSLQVMKQLIAINKIELLLERIVYIQSSGHYCQIFMNAQQKNSMDLRISINRVAKEFDSEQLVRIHRSYLINPKKVQYAEKKAVRNYILWLRDSYSNRIFLPIARSQIEKMMENHSVWFDHS